MHYHLREGNANGPSIKRKAPLVTRMTCCLNHHPFWRNGIQTHPPWSRDFSCGTPRPQTHSEPDTEPAPGLHFGVLLFPAKFLNVVCNHFCFQLLRTFSTLCNRSQNSNNVGCLTWPTFNGFSVERSDKWYAQMLLCI